MDYDSVVNTIAAAGTVIALVFGIRAYSVAQHANRLALEARQDAERLAKEQGRKTFELEVLREMHHGLQTNYHDLFALSMRDFRDNPSKIMSVFYEALHHFNAHVALVGSEQLPKWHVLTGGWTPPDDPLSRPKDWMEFHYGGESSPSMMMVEDLRAEVLDAIKRRTE